MNRRGFLRTGIAGLGALALGAKFRPRVAEAKAPPPPVATSGYAHVDYNSNATISVTTTSVVTSTAWTWVPGATVHGLPNEYGLMRSSDERLRILRR